MVEASKALVTVMVDCTGGRFAELQTRYSIKGYPTVLFTDAKGGVIEELGDRSPAGVKTQIEAIAKKHAKSFPATFDAVKDAAVKDGKLVLFIFATKGKDSAALEATLFVEAMAEAMGKFVVARTVIKRDDAEAKRFGVTSYEQPVLLVLDPTAEKPEAAPLKKIVGKKTAKELLKEFQSIKKPTQKDA